MLACVCLSVFNLASDTIEMLMFVCLSVCVCLCVYVCPQLTDCCQKYSGNRSKFMTYFSRIFDVMVIFYVMTCFDVKTYF